MPRIITPDDDALAASERTSTVVMVVILIGLMFMPDLFGCGGAQTSARSADTTVSTDSAVAP
jgi:hypothetical protein